MGKIDDLLQLRPIEIENEKLSRKIREHVEMIRNLKTIAETKDGLQLQITQDRIDDLTETLNSLHRKYDENESKIEEFLEEKGLNYLGTFDYKGGFLGELISSSHITEMEEEPAVYFKKLIRLIGEDELAKYDYVRPEDIYPDYGKSFDEEEYEEEYEEEVTTSTPHRYTIEDFIYGEEDKLIGVAEKDSLKKKILASKLSWLLHNSDKVDIRAYMEEYEKMAEKDGLQYTVMKDEYDFIDVESTLNNFEQCAISQDNNFYLVLGKYLKDMGLSISTFLDYIPYDVSDDVFLEELARAVQTGEFTYRKEFSDTFTKVSDMNLYAWLEGKDKELSGLEAEEKTISEAEALIAKQTKKEGQNIGEE